MSRLHTRLKVALPLFVLALSGSAAAQEIADRATLDAILGSNQTLEDFESFDVADFDLAFVGFQISTIDSTTVVSGQGPGLVDGGASYSFGFDGALWLGSGFGGSASRSLRLRGPADQQITYSGSVTAMGLEVLGDNNSSSTYNAEMDVFDTSGNLVGSVSKTIASVDGTRVFFGFEHAPGIGFVRLRNPVLPFRGNLIDDHGFGEIALPGILADECSSISFVEVGSVALDIDTNNCFDTLAPATTSALQSNFCPEANNDGWIVWRPTVSGMVTVSLCNAANFDTVLAVYEEDPAVLCQATLLNCNDDSPGCGGFTSELQFMANLGTFYLVQIGAFQPNGFGAGTLTITEQDAGPVNDECSGAVALNSAGSAAYDSTTSTTSAPTWTCASGGSDLWYSYTAVGNSDMTVSLCGSTYDTALEIFSGTCGNLILEGCNDDFCALQSEITFAPVNGINYFIRVGGFNGAVGAGQIMVTQDGALGVNYCVANTNSTGQSAVMSVAGSASAASNDLTLTADQLPPNVNGFFLTSMTQGFVAMPGAGAGISAGNLCILGDIGRYISSGQIQGSGSTGSFSLAVDLTQTPQPNSTVSIQNGETWNFQAWFRDTSPTGSSSSNFTDGIEVTFQ